MIYRPKMTFKCRIVQRTASAVDWLYTKPTFVLLHDAGGNEKDILDRVHPFLGAHFTVVSIRGPVHLGKSRYAWFDPMATQDNQLPLSTVRQVHDEVYEFMATDCFSNDEGRKSIWIYAEGQAAVLGLYNYVASHGTADCILTVGARYPENLRQSSAWPRRNKVPKLYLAYGLRDEAVPVEEGRALHHWLSNYQSDIHYSEHDMGHTPNHDCLTSIRKFHSQLFPGSPGSSISSIWIP